VFFAFVLRRRRRKGREGKGGGSAFVLGVLVRKCIVLKAGIFGFLIFFPITVFVLDTLLGKMCE
jgi:hypothetical protein